MWSSFFCLKSYKVLTVARGAPTFARVRSFFTYWVVLRRAAARSLAQACGWAVGRVRNASPFREGLHCRIVDFVLALQEPS